MRSRVNYAERPFFEHGAIVGSPARGVNFTAGWVSGARLAALCPPGDWRTRFHQILSGLAAATHRPNGRSRFGSPGDFSQEPAVSRVISDVNAMLDSLPFTPMDDRCRDRPGQLVSAVIVAFVQGDLKPGDPFPQPAELARTCHMPRHEVLAAIGYLLSHRILQQDRSGALRIHRGAAPTIEMKQQAFLARARQLVGQARQWHLPADCLDPLFHKAAHEKP